MGRPRRTSRDQRRRHLGQNFLVDKRLVRRLVASVEPGDLVVDFGAGNGALTLAAADVGARVIAVERDPVWSEHMRRRARASALEDRVRVVHGDLRSVPLPSGPWRVIASPPFNLTTTLLRRLLDTPQGGPASIDLVLQWEVARKLAAQPPRTLRATSWAPWWSMTLIERVPRTAFRPVPRVDAGWLRIERRATDILSPDLCPTWEAFVRAHWPHRS